MFRLAGNFSNTRIYYILTQVSWSLFPLLFLNAFVNSVTFFSNELVECEATIPGEVSLLTKLAFVPFIP
jgi:hypothetical protein